MTQEDKELLLKDLCARLPYGVICQIYYETYDECRFTKCAVGNYVTSELVSVYPATKEQRDLLFEKMKEADYWWDFENKELKKF